MDLLKKIGRKLESPRGAPRITEQPRRHGSSARYIHDLMTQNIGLGGVVSHVARCQGSRLGAQDRSSLFLVIPFGRTVITLHTPPMPHGPRASSMQARVRVYNA